MNSNYYFVDGIQGAHKGNCMRHINADSLHDWEKKIRTMGKIIKQMNRQRVTITIKKKSMLFFLTHFPTRVVLEVMGQGWGCEGKSGCSWGHETISVS